MEKKSQPGIPFVKNKSRWKKCHNRKRWNQHQLVLENLLTSRSVNGKTSVRVYWIMIFRDQKITGPPLHPTPNLQITFVGNEECLPWTLYRLKLLWPGSDLYHPLVWELEWSQMVLWGRFGPPLRVLLPSPYPPLPVRCVVCLSMWHQAVNLYLETMRRDPAPASILEDIHHTADWLLMRNCWGNCLQSFVPAASVLLPLEHWLTF